MRAGYVDKEEAKRQRIQPGWYVFDETGRRVQGVGPFESQEAAEEWIEENTPPPPRRSRDLER